MAGKVTYKPHDADTETTKVKGLKHLQLGGKCVLPFFTKEVFLKLKKNAPTTMVWVAMVGGGQKKVEIRHLEIVGDE